MKKIVNLLFLLIVSSSILNADDYPSIHNNTLLTNFTPTTTTYSFTSSLNVYQKVIRDSFGGNPYYPQGWKQFKFYVPGGSNAYLVMGSGVNTNAIIHMKYNPDNNINTQTMNHYAPSTSTKVDLSGSTTSELTMKDYLQTSVINKYSSIGGWVYVDVVGDCYNAQFCPETIYLNISVELYRATSTLYDEWLSSTNFLSPGGDPSSNNAWLNIIDLPAQNAPASRTIALDYGGNPSSYSPPSSSSETSISSSSLSSIAVSSSFSSTASYSSSASSITQTCPAGTTWNGWACISSTSSSGVTSSVASSTASSCVSGGSILPGPGGTTSTCVPSTSSSTATSSSSVDAQSCATGYVKNSFGICVIATSLSSSSSSSSSSSLDANLTSAPMTINKGWNFIAIPIETKDTVDLNTTFSNAIGANGYGYKFKFITDANQSYEWIPWSSGTSGTLSPGEGIFLANVSGQESTATFKGAEDTNSTKLSSISFIPNKWYIVGFGYDLYLSDIKTLYPNSAVWTLDSNGAYKKEENNATIIEKGKGFWFKRYE